MSLWAAEVSEESQKPTILLLSTSTEAYNIEVEEFDRSVKIGEYILLF